LDQFKDCFGHRAQHVSLRQYVDGLLGDSARKSMAAMLARVSDPTSYQAFQHFITHAPWEAEVVWRRLRAVVPERRGILILDETSFPKSGAHSVGVARQYCGALGKVANCQVAVTAALWTGQRAWPMGALLYLPEEWASNRPRRATVQIPSAVAFHEKWRLALTLVRRTRAAGVTLTAVVADAEYGDNSTVRQTLHRLRLPYALGISPTLTVPRHAGDGLAAPTTRAGNLGALRARRRADRPAQTLFRVAAAIGLAQADRTAGPSPLGDRTALSGPEVGTRPRSFRRTDVPRLATPRGDQCRRVCVSSDRTSATPRGPAPHVSAGAGLRTGNLHGAAVCQPPSLHAVDEAGRTAVSSTADLTKSY
jgi:hypothetical protein